MLKGTMYTFIYMYTSESLNCVNKFVHCSQKNNFMVFHPSNKIDHRKKCIDYHAPKFEFKKKLIIKKGALMLKHENLISKIIWSSNFRNGHKLAFLIFKFYWTMYLSYFRACKNSLNTSSEPDTQIILHA